MAPTVPKVAYLVPDLEHDTRTWELVAYRQISTPVFLPGNVGFTITSYSSRALAVDTDSTIYKIRVEYNDVVSCICPDFTDCGGACKHIRGALLILDDLCSQGMNVPAIPIPQSLADAQALQAVAVSTITIHPAKAELPTSHAAEKIEHILREDDGCMESNSDGEDAADDDDDVATDASSDSESESDKDDGDGDHSKRHAFAAQNVTALGEQPISRTVFQLREMGSTFADLGEYLDQRVTGLSSEECKEIGRGYGHLVNLMAKMEQVLSLPALPAPPVVKSLALPSAGSSMTRVAPKTDSQIGVKRKQLLLLSPEKSQKRH
ncbi:hypothetical protein B0H19DRAFT_1258870 [Mycena capillaripes]|nr:hypothetical protein B0H19DRAFT_1258870 [Mycena capillaripes]